ncbi:hypothetical protein PR048_017291 [Dryococelus australis]|uniref:Uncharacterized protein n=1 Tax=Dryococelus australis TaxID=614101 RepID=A0ABQ9H969_9NEOP|nr:hypothetical protein PR048_017291 [Dryococelus australis]
MMPLVGGFSRGSPVSPASSFQCRSIFTSITLIGSQDLAIQLAVSSPAPLCWPHLKQRDVWKTQQLRGGKWQGTRELSDHKGDTPMTPRDKLVVDEALQLKSVSLLKRLAHRNGHTRKQGQSFFTAIPTSDAQVLRKSFGRLWTLEAYLRCDGGSFDELHASRPLGGPAGLQVWEPQGFYSPRKLGLLSPPFFTNNPGDVKEVVVLKRTPYNSGIQAISYDGGNVRKQVCKREAGMMSWHESVDMEQRWNAQLGKTGGTRKDPPTCGNVYHDSHIRKSGSAPTSNRARFALAGGERESSGRSVNRGPYGKERLRLVQQAQYLATVVCGSIANAVRLIAVPKSRFHKNFAGSSDGKAKLDGSADTPGVAICSLSGSFMKIVLHVVTLLRLCCPPSHSPSCSSARSRGQGHQCVSDATSGMAVETVSSESKICGLRVSAQWTVRLRAGLLNWMREQCAALKSLFVRRGAAAGLREIASEGELPRRKLGERRDARSGESDWPRLSNVEGVRGELQGPQAAKPLAGRATWQIIAALQLDLVHSARPHCLLSTGLCICSNPPPDSRPLSQALEAGYRHILHNNCETKQPESH